MNERNKQGSLNPLEQMLGRTEEDPSGASLVEGQSSSHLLKEQVERLLGPLPDSLQAVLRLRFGFYDGVQRSLREAGRELGVAHSTVLRRERRALTMLREPQYSKRLGDFIGML